MSLDMQQIARIVRATRKGQGLTQAELASIAGVGARFIVELEKAKPTLSIEKVLHVFNALGIELSATTRSWNIDG